MNRKVNQPGLRVTSGNGPFGTVSMSWADDSGTANEVFICQNVKQACYFIAENRLKAQNVPRFQGERARRDL